MYSGYTSQIVNQQEEQPKTLKYELETPKSGIYGNLTISEVF